MPIFLWKGTNSQGRTRKGEIEAKDKAAAQQLLKWQNISVTSVKPKPKDLFENIEFLQPGVKTKDLILFTRQFSTMIDAGLPLMQGLEILATENGGPDDAAGTVEFIAEFTDKGRKTRHHELARFEKQDGR